MGCHVLLRGIFPTPWIEPMSPVSPALRRVLYLLSHQGSSQVWGAMENFKQERDMNREQGGSSGGSETHMQTPGKKEG